MFIVSCRVFDQVTSHSNPTTAGTVYLKCDTINKTLLNFTIKTEYMTGARYTILDETSVGEYTVDKNEGTAVVTPAPPVFRFDDDLKLYIATRNTSVGSGNGIEYVNVLFVPVY